MHTMLHEITSPSSNIGVQRSSMRIVKVGVAWLLILKYLGV